MKNDMEKIDDFIKQFEMLNELGKKAVWWLINHINIAEELSISEDKLISEDESKKIIQEAIERQDYVCVALFNFKKIYRNEINLIKKKDNLKER